MSNHINRELFNKIRQEVNTEQTITEIVKKTIELYEKYTKEEENPFEEWWQHSKYSHDYSLIQCANDAWNAATIHFANCYFKGKV